MLTRRGLRTMLQVQLGGLLETRARNFSGAQGA